MIVDLWTLLKLLYFSLYSAFSLIGTCILKVKVEEREREREREREIDREREIERERERAVIILQIFQHIKRQNRLFLRI